jgi:CheY-like chemotaxis protein
VKKRILVVDDAPVMRDVLRLILEAGGYEVLEARHGGDALVQMRRVLPDLVITDLMMPVMTGQQLVRRLRADARTAAIPILILSANPNAALMAETADAVVGKPFQRGRLIAAVNTLVPIETSPPPSAGRTESIQNRAGQRFSPGSPPSPTE